MLFKCLKRMIEKGNYESKEAMAEKISIQKVNGYVRSIIY